jgi:hypothetical protein
MKNISVSLKFWKIGYEAPEWLSLDLGSFEFRAPAPYLLKKDLDNMDELDDYHPSRMPEMPVMQYCLTSE